MKRMMISVLILAGATTFVLWAQTSGALRPVGTDKPSASPTTGLIVQEMDGGSVITDLGYNIQVNKGSTLRRSWFVVNDPASPLRLQGAGIRPIYKSGGSYSSGEYNYVAVGFAQPQEDIRAFEIRFLLFDVWGQHMQTLSSTEVTDLAAGSSVDLSKAGQWRAWSENDVSELLTVVAYVSAARTRAGIWRADPKALLREVEKIKVRLTEQQLEPEKRRPAQ